MCRSRRGDRGCRGRGSRRRGRCCGCGTCGRVRCHFPRFARPGPPMAKGRLRKGRGRCRPVAEGRGIASSSMCKSRPRPRAKCFSSMFLGCRGGGQGRARLCSSMFASGRVGSRGRVKLLSSMFAAGCRGGGQDLARLRSSMFSSVTASSMFVGQGDTSRQVAVWGDKDPRRPEGGLASCDVLLDVQLRARQPMCGRCRCCMFPCESWDPGCGVCVPLRWIPGW
jgi:hypothetical protein